MNVTKKIIILGTTLLSIAAPAFAATYERGKPSNFVVYAFLALCALIIVAQILPLARKIIIDTDTASEKTDEIASEKTQDKKQQGVL